MKMALAVLADAAVANPIDGTMYILGGGFDTLAAPRTTPSWRQWRDPGSLKTGLSEAFQGRVEHFLSSELGRALLGE